jgi:hypothetical protein
LTSKPARRTHRPRKILGADALVHARAMVVAGEQVAERIEGFAFNPFGQFLRPPGLANQAHGAVTIAFPEQRPRQRKAALGARRPVAGEAVNRRGIAALLPQASLGAPAQLAHARPSRIIGDETRVAGEIRGPIRVFQNEPFDELLGGRIADRFHCGGRLASLSLAYLIDGVLDRRKVAGQRSCLHRFAGFRGRFRFAPRRTLRMLSFLILFFIRGVAMMPGLASRIGFLVVLNLLMAGMRRRITRKCCEHGQAEDASQRTEALVHSVIPREPNGMSHEIARSVRLERHGS